MLAAFAHVVGDGDARLDTTAVSTLQPTARASTLGRGARDLCLVDTPDGIYLACLRRARGQLEKAIFDATSSTTDPREQLELGADAYFGFVESDVARWRVLFGGGAAVSGEVAEEAMELHLATERQFAALLAAAAPGADDELVRAYAHGIGGAAHQIAEWWLRTKGIPRQTVVRWYCELCWCGMGPVVQRRGAKPA